MSTRLCFRHNGHTDPREFAGACGTCRKASTDPAYHALWGEVIPLPENAKPRPANSPDRRPACVHLGVVLVPCHSCGGRKRDVRDCAVHGRVTPTECGKDVDMTCERCVRDNLGYEGET